MDNFIEFVVVLVNMFLSNRGAIIIMHANDPQVLKEICSFLEASHEVDFCELKPLDE
jgi:hypothetical protein